MSAGANAMGGLPALFGGGGGTYSGRGCVGAPCREHNHGMLLDSDLRHQHCAASLTLWQRHCHWLSALRGSNFPRQQRGQSPGTL